MKFEFIITGIRRVEGAALYIGREPPSNRRYILQALRDSDGFAGWDSIEVPVEDFGPERLPPGSRVTMETSPPDYDEQGINMTGVLALKNYVRPNFERMSDIRDVYPGLYTVMKEIMDAIQNYIKQPNLARAQELREQISKHDTDYKQWGIFKD